MAKNKINIGDGNKIKDSNISTGDVYSNQNKEKKPFLNKVLIPLIVAITAAVIAGIILFAIKMS